MFRSVGSVAFGIAADRYGRKWPFIVNNVLFICLELGTAFCQTYRQFLACRALFGIAMGGLYGNAAATALEDLPGETRGIMSGILQQGVCPLSPLSSCLLINLHRSMPLATFWPRSLRVLSSTPLPTAGARSSGSAPARPC